MGAYYSKKYRNVLKEFGYTDEAIQYKIDEAWNSLFYGDDNTRIYYETENNEAYIYDVGSNDVRSEGMSYGMMMCVQMNKQAEFDRIWKWAKTHMQFLDGPQQGYFRWSMHTDGSSNSNGPAPDGEEYFAMALLFASKRWGDKEAPFDYSVQARYILHKVLHQEDEGTGCNMWNRNKLIKFVPDSVFSDPSYHLPHFYELFALWANEEDREYWKEAATLSREYLKLACHPITGLTADYATFEGAPETSCPDHDKFSNDAYRVAGNIALDYSWFEADPWEVEQSNRLQAFFAKEGIGNQFSIYEIDGTRVPEGDYQALSLISMIAMASLAADGPDAKAMVEYLWSKSPAQGQWRYYDDCLYFFAILALSGNYRIWE